MQEFFLEFTLRMLVLTCVLGIYLFILRREEKLCAKDVYFTLVALIVLCIFPIDRLFRMGENRGFFILSPEYVYIIKTICTCIYVVVDSLKLLEILMTIWLCGIFAFGYKEIHQYFQLKKYIDRWELSIDSSFAKVYVEEYSLEFGINKKIDIKICNGIDSPFVMGIRRPLIVVPQILVNTDRLSYMIRHELIHIKRHDNLIKTFIRSIRILNWYNLIFQRIEEYITLYCEISCDQDAVKDRSREFRRQYAETLLKAAELQCYNKHALVNDFISDRAKINKRIDGVIGIRNRKNKSAAFILLILFCIMYFIVIQITDSNNKVIEAYNSTTDMSILNNASMISFSNTIRKLTFEEYNNYGFVFDEESEQLYYENLKVKEFNDDFHRVYYYSDKGNLNVVIKRNSMDEITGISIIDNNLKS